jgi:hypothetical protein
MDVNRLVHGACSLSLGLAMLSFARFAAAQGCLPPPTGVIAWWPFDEAAGLIAHDLGGDHPAAWFAGAAPAVGRVDGAIRLNGTTDFVAAADSDLWAFGKRSFTIELWANFDAPVGGTLHHPGAIFVGNDEGPGNLAKWFFAIGGGYLNFHINGPALGPQFFPLAAFAPQPGRWYHLAVTRNVDLYTVFVDGSAIGSATNAETIPDAQSSLTIGQAEGLGFVHGRLDELTVYDRALAPAELQAIAAAGASGKCKLPAPDRVVPARGGDTGSISVKIIGHGFHAGARARLTRGGHTVLGGSPSLDDSGTMLTTRFDLIGQERGAWSVVVENLDGTFTVLPDGFTVEAGRSAEAWVDVVGPGAIRVGQESTLLVLVGNSGNVDAPVSHVTLDLPPGLPHRLVVEGAAHAFADGQYHLTLFDLAGGEVRLAKLSLTPPAAGDIAVTMAATSNVGAFLGLRGRLTEDTSLAAGRDPKQGPVVAARCRGTSDYEAQYPAVHPGTLEAEHCAPAGYIYTFHVGFPAAVQQGLSMGRNDDTGQCELRWSFDSTGGTETTTLRSALTDPIYVVRDVVGAQRPTRDWGLNGSGGIITQERMRQLAMEATRPLVTPKIPFSSSRQQLRLLGELYQSQNPKAPQWRKELGEKLGQDVSAFEFDCHGGFTSGNRECTPYMSCADFTVTGLNRIVDSLNLNEKTTHDPYPGIVTNETIAHEAATRNCYDDQVAPNVFNFLKKASRTRVTKARGSLDPNQKTGPAGISTDGFQDVNRTLPYLTHFENDAHATAPAREVTVSDPLDSTVFDLGSVSFGAVTVGAKVLEPLPGARSIDGMLDLRPESDLLVHVEAGMDAASGLLTWRLSTIDPATGLPPLDPFRGFLPPNANPPQGEASVFFTVALRTGLATGTLIRNRALITFDANPPIPTAEWVNTVDASKPASEVLALAPVQTMLDFPVQWSGSDLGSGVKDYSIYVAEDGGAAKLWLAATADTAATFHGVSGRSYAFYSIARDFANNVEDPPAVADATTRIAVLPPVIRSISPRMGPGAGGTLIAIEGSGFAADARVDIGGAPAPVVGVDGAARITVLDGPHAPGVVDVTVTNPAVPSVSLPQAFSYVEDSVGLQFFTLPPCRVLDTRNPEGPPGGPSLDAWSRRIIGVTGACGISPSAKAVAINFTLVAPASSGFVSLSPGDSSFATASIRAMPGRTRSTNSIVLVAGDGTGTLGLVNGSGASVHVLLDVGGYFQ